MLKFAILLGAIGSLYRYPLAKWPWEWRFGGDTRSQAVFKARKLLRVDAGASRQDILAAHKRLVAMVHPDKGGTNAKVHEANDARDLLLDELPGKGADIGSDTPSQD